MGSGMPNACNLCHLDRSLAWTRDKLLEGWGKRVSLPVDPMNTFGKEHVAPAGESWLRHPDGMTRAVAGAAYGETELGRKALPDAVPAYECWGIPNIIPPFFPPIIPICYTREVKDTSSTNIDQLKFDIFPATIDVFDPRANQWRTGPSLSSGRGAHLAALASDSIYVIGGLGTPTSVRILDSIESVSISDFRH